MSFPGATFFKKKSLFPLNFTTKFYKVHLIHEKWKRSTTERTNWLRRGLDIDGDMEKLRYCRQREVHLYQLTQLLASFFFVLILPSNIDFYIYLTNFLNELD